MFQFIKVLLIAVCILIVSIKINAQVQQFTVTVSDTLPLLSMPPVHSFAFAKWNNKWIIIGGRVNGLHGFTPPSGFLSNGINGEIYIVDPLTDTRKQQNILAAFTDTTMRDALQSAFFQYAQHDSMLYITGGYGVLTDSADNYTQPNLIAVNLNQLDYDMQNSLPIAQDFRLIQDQIFKVCGGNMFRIDSTYYLVFGHDFNHSYSVNDTLGYFTQQYTCEIRSFVIHDDGVNLSFSNYNTIHDSINFHRRDYNLVPQVFPDGSYGHTAFSGVFQYLVNQPYLNTIDIKPQGYDVINNFNQNLSQYNSAVMPVYNAADNKMSTVFFGGMSLYQYDSTHTNLITDSLIPFVSTISKVVRNVDSSLVEYLNPTSMPALIGTNSLFIPDAAMPLINDEIINLNSLPFGNTFAGLIISGINSDLPNINTDPTQSHASGIVYKVYINKFIDTKVADIEVKNEILNLIAYPNPTNKLINIEFETSNISDINVTIYDSKGSTAAIIYNGTKLPGKHELNWEATKSGTYFCKVQTNKYSKTIKVLVK